MLLAFSMYITVPAVTTSKQPPGAYNCLNGLRVLAMLAVIFGHTFVLGPFGSPMATGKISGIYDRFKMEENIVFYFMQYFDKYF